MSTKEDLSQIPNVEWKTETRKISDLIPHERNPRQLSKGMHEKLLNSFKKFNYVECAAINLDGKIIAGHQRIKIMQDLGWNEKEIDVRIPSRKLTKKECDEYLLISNKVTGEWDWDILSNEWEEAELFEAGFLKEEIYGKENTDSEAPDINLDINQNPIIEVECNSIEHQKELYEEFTKRGLECRLLTL